MAKLNVQVGGTVYQMNSITYSKLERTILDWDSDYMSEFRRENAEVVEKYTDSSDIRMRVNEFGQIVQAPLAPTPIDQSNWKRITEKRQAMLDQYEQDLADYEVTMAKWLELPFLDEGRTRDEFIHDLIVSLRNKPLFHGITFRKYYDYLNGVFDPKPAVLVYWVKKFGEIRICSRPVTNTELEIVECDVNNNYWAQQGFEGNASHERRRYKRNRDLDMDTEYDTDLETGEKRQLTLFNCNTSCARELPDLNVLESFIEKPNSYLAKAYLEYILNGTDLTDWQRFQLMRRNSRRTWSIH